MTDTPDAPTAEMPETAAGDGIADTVFRKMDGPAPKSSENINAIFGVPLTVTVVLGRSRMPISDLLDLRQGSVVPLDKAIGEPVDVMVNDAVVAQGEMVRVDENRIGITLTKIVRTVVPDHGK